MPKSKFENLNEAVEKFRTEIAPDWELLDVGGICVFPACDKETGIPGLDMIIRIIPHA